MAREYAATFAAKEKAREHRAFMRHLRKAKRETDKWPEWVRKSAAYLFEESR